MCKILNFYRKKEREKDRGGVLADLSKLGNLGALTGLEIEEEEEEDEVFGETYADHTGLSLLNIRSILLNKIIFFVF